jgi:uncharacterized protein (DUF1499 family)
VARFFGGRVSRGAVWSRRLSRFVTLVLLVTVIGHRVDLIDTPTALVLLGLSWTGAVFALVCGLSAFSAIWRLGIEGLGQAFTGVISSVPVLAVPVYFVVLLASTPRLTDVTTDLVDPPQFTAAAALRAPTDKGIVYPGPAAVAVQQQNYPEIRSFRVALEPAGAYEAVKAVVEEQGWEVTLDRPPTDDNQEGKLEAVARSLLMAFKDDVAIRVRPAGSRVRIDIRSASRFGGHDFGANARRVTQFLYAVREKAAPTSGGEK